LLLPTSFIHPLSPEHVPLLPISVAPAAFPGSPTNRYAFAIFFLSQPFPFPFFPSNILCPPSPSFFPVYVWHTITFRARHLQPLHFFFLTPPLFQVFLVPWTFSLFFPPCVFFYEIFGNPGFSSTRQGLPSLFPCFLSQVIPEPIGVPSGLDPSSFSRVLEAFLGNLGDAVFSVLA